MCAGNELFFMSLYLQYFTPGIMSKLVLIPPLHLYLPPSSLVTFFNYQRGMWEMVSIACFPIFFLKQVVSVVQLVVAARKIASRDIERREREAQPN